MNRMKTAIAEEKYTTSISINVKCPYCNTTLVGIASYALVIKCWHCKRPFKVFNPEDIWDDYKDEKKKRG